jgi:uncharacterized protein YbaP (TraB family)
MAPRKWVGHAVYCTIWLAMALAQTAVRAQDAPAENNEPLEQVEVLGERPGPQMWKVVKGDHTLWILGTLSPLPQGMKWRSKPVEDVIAVSQEVLSGDVNLDADIGPITAFRLWRQWRHVRDNPDDATLKDVLPTPLYSRFSALRTKYAPRDNDMEELQPMFAGGVLFGKAVSASKLTSDRYITKSVLKLAKKHDVKIERVKVPIEDPKGLLDVVAKTPLSAQLVCLDTTLSRLEMDVSTMAARAEAWSVGDVDALRNLPYINQEAACWAAVSDAPRIKKIGDRVRFLWMEAAEKALEQNKSTLALVSIERLIGAEGLLATFQKKGYSVEGP